MSETWYRRRWWSRHVQLLKTIYHMGTGDYLEASFVDHMTRLYLDHIGLEYPGLVSCLNA